MTPMQVDELPAALALELDTLCDDFERHWRRSRRRGLPSPGIEAFLDRASATLRPALSLCLSEMDRELRCGIALPEVPGLILEEEIGRGGMGVVYRATRIEDGRTVAVKLIAGAEHGRWSRWLAELSDLHHPNLISLEAFGAHGGLHFVVMPLAPGGDLRERFSEFVVGPEGDSAAVRRVVGLMAKVADAVAFLHKRGILHRDLKPSNILLGDAPDREPLVCDFGLAGRLGETVASPQAVVGTPRYMAPEQMDGEPLGPAADVWSLGVILHELLTGLASRCPWNRSIHEDLERICLHCLHRHVAKRYPSASILADDLRRYLNAVLNGPRETT